MIYMKKFRKFKTKGVYGCIGVLFLLFASKLHNSKNITIYQSNLKRKNICNKFNINTDRRMLSGYLLRRDSHLLYYCDVPKCGSTFMNTFLGEAFSCDDCHLKRVRMAYKRKLYNYVKEMIKNSTYSFMIAREPYGRLFAAYVNKLYCPNEFWRKLGVDVIKTVRENASVLSERYGHDVTFSELAKYIIDSTEQGKDLNIHLAPIYTRCNPCQMEFNFIGKLENMTSNLMQLVDDWKRNGVNIDLKTNVNLKELELKNKRDLGPVEHLFTILAESPKLPRYKLFERLWSGYQIRGLILNDNKMPFTEDIADSIDHVMHMLAVEEAMETSMKNITALKSQRHEATVQAYRALPSQYLLKLRNVYKLDFALFDYDEMPREYFDRVENQDIHHTTFV